MGIFDRLFGGKKTDTNRPSENASNLEKDSTDNSWRNAGGQTSELGSTAPTGYKFDYKTFQQKSGFIPEMVGGKAELGSDPSGKPYGNAWGFKAGRNHQVAMTCPQCQQGWGNNGSIHVTPTDGYAGWSMNASGILEKASEVKGSWGFSGESTVTGGNGYSKKDLKEKM